MFELKIDEMENEAFSDDARAETVRIIREIADKLENGREEGACKDFNGNTVGRWSYCEPE